MSVVIGTLTIDLKANTASFSQSMDKMSQLSAKTATDIKRSLDKIATAGIAMAAAVAGATAGLVLHALDSADAMDKLAQATGTTTETLSKLQYAASLSNVENAQLAKGLELLSRNAFAAANGNAELSKIFGTALKVNVRDANGHLKDSGVLLSELAVRFAGYADGASKTALAQKVFGKSGAELIPMLNQYGSEQAKVNKEAEQFGLILGSKTAALAAEAHDNLDRLHAVVKGLGFSLLGATLPALSSLIQKLIDVAKNADIPALAKSFGEHVANAVHTLGDALAFATAHARALKIALEALAALQLSKIAIPLIADLANGGIDKAGAGLLKFASSALGITKVAKSLEQFAGWLKYTAGFVRLMAAEEGIAAAASYVLGGAISAIGGPVTLAIAAVAGLIALLYKFRTSTFQLQGETYQLRDVWNGAWIAMKHGMTATANAFGSLVDWMKGVWSKFINWFESLNFVATLKKWFAGAAEWAGKILGKVGTALTPTWLIEGMKEAKLEREKEATAKDVTDHSDKNDKKKLPPAPDVGLGKPQKDLFGNEVRTLDQQAVSAARYIAALGKAPEVLQHVNAEAKANAEIVKLNNSLLDAGRPKLTAHQEAILQQKFALLEGLDALKGYKEELTGQARSTELALAQTAHLTLALSQNDEAVRAAAVDNALLALTYGKTREEIKALDPVLKKLRAELTAKGNGEAREEVVRETTDLRDQVNARAGLALATLQGADAYRQAALASSLYTLNEKIAITQDPALRQAYLAKRQALLDLAKTERDEAVAQDAVRLKGPLFALAEDRKRLRDAIDALTEGGKRSLTYAEQLEVSAAAQDQFNQTIDRTVDLLLRQGKARDGVAAFFLNMQRQAKTTAAIIFEAFNTAFERLSDNLASLLTGAKADFGAMLRDIGKQITKSVIQQALQKGLAAIGKKLGFDLGGLSKPDGSAAKPFHVILAGGGSNPTPGVPKPGADEGDDDKGKGGGLLSKVGGFFSGLWSKLSGVFSSIAGGAGKIFSFLGGLIPHASGGDVNPSSAYLVGENGPEILTGTSGRITSHTESMRSLAGSHGPTLYYSIDARGADAAAVEQRTRSAIIAAHNSAIVTGQKVSQERVLRMPSNRR